MEKEEFLSILPNIPDEKLTRIANSFEGSKYSEEEIALAKEELIKRSQELFSKSPASSLYAYNSCNTTNEEYATNELKPNILDSLDSEYISGSANKYATKSIIFGCISIITWIIPLFGFPTTILSLVFGFKGLKSSKRNRALVGIILGGIFLLVTTVNSVIGAINGVNMSIKKQDNSNHSSEIQTNTLNNTEEDIPSEFDKPTAREILDKANEISKESRLRTAEIERMMQDTEKSK